MNVRFFGLALICASPWLYMAFVSALVSPAQAFTGFKALPFFLLLWLKEQALMTREERDRAASRDEPYWKMPIYILAGVVLVVGAVLSADALREFLGGAVVAVLGGLVLVLFFAWDMKRAYRRTQRSA